MKTNTGILEKILGGSTAARDLEATLRAARPRIEAPVDLREDIMRQVQVSNQRQAAHPEPARSFRLWQWAAVPAAAAVLVFGLVISHNPDRGNTGAEAASLRVASRVLETEQQIPGDFTAAMMGPLHEELNRLDSDLKRAAEHLLASLP
jgi:hypothetical protein